ncbi:DNA helicase [Sphingobium subterraneum]|uniref:Replicative DNA helicase n=1 Tax=Sphingobium subterraneum TaxID=627688 RepID=A0A841J1W4_9SPHN|nr:DNA helicase [Sphingobium subterraneum]MBB6123526.1 replicative DNA helicase [Sphingobium subterraneum]
MRLSAPIFKLKRQAKLLARDANIPLHAALDQTARNEGFYAWSHLAAFASNRRPTHEILAQLAPGDLVLLGARPGHGKTLMGLELAIEAVRTDRPAFFFTLEDHEGVVFDRLQMLGTDRKAVEGKLLIDTSDDICADHIIDRIGHRISRAVAIVDYLQLLDQRRHNPELEVQIKALRMFASTTSSIIVLLSQIDRAFETTPRSIPGMTDIRLPNPLDFGLFTKACFMHDGETYLEEIA